MKDRMIRYLNDDSLEDGTLIAITDLWKQQFLYVYFSLVDCCSSYYSCRLYVWCMPTKQSKSVKSGIGGVQGLRISSADTKIAAK